MRCGFDILEQKVAVGVEGDDVGDSKGCRIVRRVGGRARMLLHHPAQRFKAIGFGGKHSRHRIGLKLEEEVAIGCVEPVALVDVPATHRICSLCVDPVHFPKLVEDGGKRNAGWLGCGHGVMVLC